VNGQESVDTKDLQNVISVAIGSGENEISKLKLEITRKDLEYKGLPAKCYLLSVSFEQMTNKIGIAEEKNFQKSAKTIDAQNKEIEALKVNFENLEVENSRLKAQNESPNNAEENIAAPIA
jgi:predicted nuclease with TOPRIM domain